jgi:hypothetical protein
MRPNNLALLALILVSSLATAQHCRNVDIDKSTGYCTVPDPNLTPGEMDASLACSPSHAHLRQVSDSEKDLVLVLTAFLRIRRPRLPASSITGFQNGWAAPMERKTSGSNRMRESSAPTQKTKSKICSTRKFAWLIR